MKIGEFSEKNNLSINTIRHYMDLGLLNPEKSGGQYFFDQICQKEIELIIDFKKMGFSLSSIKTINMYSHFGKLTDYERSAYYRSIFTDKYKEIEREMSELEKSKEELQAKINALSIESDRISLPMGIHISILSLLKCVDCKGNLILEDGMVQHNQVMEGKLVCECGEEYQIHSGILHIGLPYEGESDIELEDYIHHTDSAYLENIYKGGEWSIRKFIDLDLSNRVILELGTGMGLFLQNIYQYLTENCLYIAVDRNIDSQLKLKKVLEQSGIKRNVLFICSDFQDLPLDNQSIDIVIDQAGTSNYHFENNDFPLNNIRSLIKPESYLVGSYFVFNNFSSNSKIESRLRKNFKEKQIIENIKGVGFDLLDDQRSKFLEKGGQYENFFVDGEKVYTYSYFGKRSG